MRSVIKELISQDRKRKVQIFRREDGSFGFEALRFGDDPLEMFWFPCSGYSECFAVSAEIAEREARGRVDWLLAEGNE